MTEPLSTSTPHEEPIDRIVAAGFASTRLVADPRSWINRRVETVELLSHDETRRQVSVDFTLTESDWADLETEQGVVVPIALLTKEPRRNFSLRDESGGAVPVLGRDQNGELAHIALFNAAYDALPETPSDDLLESLVADLRQIVIGNPKDAANALAFFLGSAESGDRWRGAIATHGVARPLLDALWNQYVLYAVLAPGGARRRILKYSYAERLPFTTDDVRRRDRLAWDYLSERIWHPDRRRFVVECPGAVHAKSFHVELAIPEELQFESAVLWDFAAGESLTDWETNVDRASLYLANASRDADPAVFAVVAAERGGRTLAATLTGGTVSALLWLGVISGLPPHSSDPGVAIVITGAAFFTGVEATQGEHRLVRRVFAASRRWLTLVSAVALAAAAMFAMETPNPQPTNEWAAAAGITTVATLRLAWSSFRAPRR